MSPPPEVASLKIIQKKQCLLSGFHIAPVRISELYLSHKDKQIFFFIKKERDEIFTQPHDS